MIRVNGWAFVFLSAVLFWTWVASLFVPANVIVLVLLAGTAAALKGQETCD